MTSVTLNRKLALLVGGLAVAGMGLTVGCSAKQAPAPTEQVDTKVDSKRGGQSDDSPNSHAPKVKAKPAPEAKPGNTPGDN